MISNMKYFLYARKSTDVEDKQVLSIEAQLSELRTLAKQERLNVVEVFVEKKSAKMPGRPVFNEMMARIQKGEAQGIVCWKLDRLSRNPVDGGQIQWLLQNSVIAHIQTHDRAYYPADNVLMMSVEFGMANQYIRDLSVNTKRGLREKARQGIYPSSAPLGYLNNPRTKTIVVDRKKSHIIRKAFEMYAENKYRLEDIANFLYQNGLRTHATRRWGNDNGGQAHSKDQMTWMLSNIFYYGHFKYGGEVYEGKHTPLVDKKLFDRVQEVLKLRGKKRVQKNSPQAYCGLLSCETCTCSISAEKQKGHIYYRCTRKKGVCTEPYVREESLNFQLSELLARFVLPLEWAAELNRLMDKDEKETTQIAAASVQEMRSKIAVLDGKIARLTDLFIEQDIERGDYLERRHALMSEKRSLQEQSLLLERDAAAWLEPMREWINEAQALSEIAQSQNYPSKKSSLQKVFGSNLTLHAREARGTAQNQWLYLAQAQQDFPKNCPLYGAPGWIRTNEDRNQQVYSLPPLTAWVPTQYDNYSRYGLYFKTRTRTPCFPFRTRA